MNPDPPAEGVSGFEARSLSGGLIRFEDFRGRVILIVNTASHCGFTPQYAGLQALHEAYADRGLVVVGFPCNQFGAQEPAGAGEIERFCQRNFGVGFLMADKVDVNGDEAHPLFKYLKAACPGVLGSQAIKWNFTKFLVDREGRPVRRYAPTTSPAALGEDIESLL
ncbi:glutathione peroxidase [Zoogloea dura]|uniref:Glutathione peroxidase n=1 Tax=Zoogloea dura TaxID=2728840 RepID=A0A848G270_9RHOO|nr:glutathione peroxidase [Zoogloea dura]NML25384.1 glutathione peroxidase [Zoogloea dura]